MKTGKTGTVTVGITKQGGTYGYVYVDYREEYDEVNNYSNLVITEMRGRNTIRAGTFYTAGSIQIDGTAKYSWNANHWCFGLGTAGDTAAFSTYSGAQYPTIGPIYHDADGSKRVTLTVHISTYYGSSPTWYGDSNCSASVTLALTDIPRASDMTVTAGDIGSAVTVNIIRASSSFTHTLRYAFAGASGIIADKTDAVTVQWTPPMELCSRIPAATQGPCTITCQTYSGSNLVGEKTLNITLTVPQSVGLTVSNGWVTATPYNEGTAAAGMDIYVQGYSAAQVSFDCEKISTQSAYGATAATYSIRCGGVKGDASHRTGVLTAAGDTEIHCTVTDTRGRTVTEVLTVTVLPYTKPTLMDIAVFRCDGDGSADDGGTAVSAYAVCDISELAGHNSYTLQARLRSRGGSYGDGVALQSGSASVLWAGNLSPRQTYEVQLTAVDALGNSALYAVIIPTDEVFFHGRQGGNGAAFGKYAEEDDWLEVAWNAKVKKNLTVEGTLRASNAAIATYTDPTKFGSSTSASISELFSALPSNSIFMREAGALTDASWNFPNAYGIVVIFKVGTSRSKTLFYGKNVSHKNYFSEVNDSGIPTGVWISTALEAYPVGAIYISTKSTSPASLFGGTWAQIQGKFLLAGNSTYAYGSSGGSATHTLTTNQIPSHTHNPSTAGKSWVDGTASAGRVGSANDGGYIAPTHTNINNWIWGTTGATGGGQAHNNMPPYLSVYMWQRTA